MKARVAGRMNAATVATLDHVAAQLWNPHTTNRIRVYEIEIADTVATAVNIGLRRSTARGATPGATVTPTIASDLERAIAPPSGAVLELAAFGTQPTLEGVNLWRWYLAATAGSAVILPIPEGIVVPPAAGLCITTPVAAAFPISDISFAWEE